MRLSHILLKVSDLDKAVKEYREKGFDVEYGSKKKPYNALIYFSTGPYLELLHKTGMPTYAKIILRLLGKKSFVKQMETWENSEPGLLAVALENERDEMDMERSILDRANQRYFTFKSKRVDTKDRELRFNVLFPDDMKIPFFMTRFPAEIHQKGFVHSNGVSSIKSISFGTREDLIPIIRELSDDPGLNLFIGDGVKDLEFEYAA